MGYESAYSRIKVYFKKRSYANLMTFSLDSNIPSEYLSYFFKKALLFKINIC